MLSIEITAWADLSLLGASVELGMVLVGAGGCLFALEGPLYVEVALVCSPVLLDILGALETEGAMDLKSFSSN